MFEVSIAVGVSVELSLILYLVRMPHYNEITESDWHEMHIKVYNAELRLLISLKNSLNKEFLM